MQKSSNCQLGTHHILIYSRYAIRSKDLFHCLTAENNFSSLAFAEFPEIRLNWLRDNWPISNWPTASVDRLLIRLDLVLDMTLSFLLVTTPYLHFFVSPPLMVWPDLYLRFLPITSNLRQQSFSVFSKYLYSGHSKSCATAAAAIIAFGLEA